MANYVRSDVAIASGLAWSSVDRYTPVTSPAPVSGSSGKILLLNSDGTYTLVEGTGFVFAGAQYAAAAGTVTQVSRITSATFTPSSTDTLETISGLSYSLTALAQILTTDNTQFPSVLLTGNDTLIGGSGSDLLLGHDGADSIDGGAGSDDMRGGAGNDTYVVDSLGDRIVEAQDAGRDTVILGTTVGAYSLGDNLENATFLRTTGVFGFGNALDNFLTGNSGGDTLVGDAGNDSLDGRSGTDTLIGGLGNDRFYVDTASDVVSELGGQGTDIVFSSTTSFTLTDAVENLTYDNGVAVDLAFSGTGNAQANVITGGDAGDSLSGLDGDDTLTGAGGGDTVQGGIGNDSLVGGVGADRLDGGADNDVLVGLLSGRVDDNAADTLTGGSGNDTFHVGTGDTVIDDVAGGTDVIYSAIATWSLVSQANVENLVYNNGDAADLAFTGTGNSLSNSISGGTNNDSLRGGDGNDTLIGAAGSDVLIGDDDSDGRDDMRGGVGDDTYYISHEGDAVSEVLNGGFDLVFLTDNVATTLGGGLRSLSGTASVLTYTLRDNVEALIYGAKASPSAPYTGGSQAMSLTGNALSNVILGGTQGDTLDGASGADYLAGGAGNDTYIVDSSQDRVYEGSFVRSGQLWSLAAAGGIDEVRSLANSYSLTISDESYAGSALVNEIERLVFIGTGNFQGYGNAYANQIVGGSGNDYLDGLGGADTLAGLGGNDTYIITSADTVVESAGGGTDTVRVSEASFTLNLPQFAAVENIVYDNGNIVLFPGDTNPLNDDAYFVGTGNALNNRIRGGFYTDSLYGLAGNDYLDGFGGADNLVGGTGHDTYVVDTAADLITELANGGIDTVQTALGSYRLGSQLENLVHTGATTFVGVGTSAANVMAGGSGKDALSGLAGNDILKGNAGDDVLTAGAGNDSVYGGLGRDSFVFNAALSNRLNVDAIFDFKAADDTFRLDNAIFTKLGTGGLSAANFHVGAAAADGNDYIVYNQSTGRLFYDADGNGSGAATVFAIVLNKAILTQADFFVI